ncbi:MAG: acylneuraminate cytidylyltransferase family protein [Candidatus Riflebacteria bacterium]|nr:acylneuraminate cytidylyltransferase family protein [Candidatus Riflebacteria bacterium]
MPGRLAVILARGGSKRLPGKNLFRLSGESLVGLAVKKALKSKCFSNVLVSTDSPEIAEEAKKAGGWVPFLRPSDLASDSATSTKALLHAVNWVIQTHPENFPEVTVLLQPTSPLLKSQHIDQAISLFENHSFTSLSSMCSVKERPEWMFHLEPDFKAVPRDQICFVHPSQKLPVFYHENGAIYIIKTRHFLENHSLYDINNHGGFIMEPLFSIDIDSELDFLFSEFLVTSGKVNPHE